MRKIYPPPFNKFAVFVLYGLLSIAVTSLAQNDGSSLASGCKPMVSTKPQIVMGYVQLFTNQPSDVKNIKWELYDYINIIAYPKDNGPWNGISPPDDEEGKRTIKQMVSDIGKAKKPPSVLLSIRNYDPKEWPDNPVDYGNFYTQTLDSINQFNFQGVDIEYPGTRGSLCNFGNGGNGGGLIWGDKFKKDQDFKNFIGKLKSGMGPEKTLMLTVGNELISQGLKDLNNNITFLNIETYHYSLYANLKFPQGPQLSKSYPNAPLDIFEQVYDEWVNSGIGPEKIIMGIDFGNTFQIVYNNPSIIDNPSVIFNMPNPIPPIGQDLKKINGLCNNPNSNELYSYPWKQLVALLDNTKCGPVKDDWIYKFDPQSSTPWLYKSISEPPNSYQFISYENYFSLNKKLGSRSIKGMSISDISYDDSESSLLNYLHGKIGLKVPGDIPPGNTTSSPGPTKTPASNDNNSKTVTTGGASPGAIAGAVFGSLIGIAILGALCFIGYRYRRDRPKSFSSFLKSLPNRKGFSSSSHTNLRNTEMTSDTSHRYDPQTTVIPVASGYVTAIFDFTGKEENDLSFKKGDKIEVLERGDGPNDWWVGRVNGAVGEFPGNYVKET